MKHLLDEIIEFVKHYRRIAATSWKARRDLEPPIRNNDELAFLPAHLELIETPISPIPRVIIRVIISFFCIALLWSAIGKLDIVAVAPGKIVVSSRTKVIQPSETSVVSRIHVRDGQFVKRGELLIELDSSGSSADLRQADDSLIAARLSQLRYSTLIRALENGNFQSIGAADGLSEEKTRATSNLSKSDFSHFVAQRDSLQAIIAQRMAEEQTVRSQIAPLERSLDIARERVSDLEKLLDGQYVARHEYLARKQEMFESERALDAERATLVEAQAALKAAKEDLRVVVEDTRQKALDGLRVAMEQIGQSAPQVDKSLRRDQLMQLRAPVDGTVQQLAVHTSGGVVTPAQQLMAIVPSKERLEVEATILNGDIGFIRPGQPTTIKIDSFPYTRYGYLEGVVESVSHDAAQDEKLGLVFPARVRLSDSYLIIGGVKVAVTPGMSLSVEVKTGKRRVIDYLLSPLVQHGEALRER